MITDSKPLNHIFFVDDLKLLARSLTKAKRLLDIITTFSKDIGMTFGQTKCAYIYIERGKVKSLGSNIEINGLSVRELKDGEQYTYLGQDESVGFDGPLNKDRVKKSIKDVSGRYGTLNSTVITKLRHITRLPYQCLHQR